jgi:hypothetical protein
LHSTKIYIYLCNGKFILMQVIDKYRILIVMGIIIGHTFLISIALTARGRIIRDPQNSHQEVYTRIETDSDSNFRETASDSITCLNSGIISEDKIAREHKMLSIDF